MECPHCDYKDSWDLEDCEYLEGSLGELYKLLVKAIQDTYGREEAVTIYVCPMCTKLFGE